MYCLNCGTQNDPEYKFCMKCGSPLEKATEPINPVEQTVVETPPTVSAPEEAPIKTAPPPQSVTPQKTFTTPRPTTIRTPEKQITIPSVTLSTPNLSTLNIWGPFAGYGTRRRHIGWVMDNKGEEAQALTETVGTKFQGRQIPGTSIQQETLVARGVIVEKRPYFILRRGLVSMALHISQFGKDLFISLASYLKPPISNFRVILFVLMLLFGIYMVVFFPASLNNAFNETANSLNPFSGRSTSPAGIFSLLCFIGPLGTINNLALILFFIYAIYSWISEKDFWKGLRVAPNEFNEDDLMAMEKAVERTVRISLDEIGLDPDDLKPTSTLHERRII